MLRISWVCRSFTRNRQLSIWYRIISITNKINYRKFSFVEFGRVIVGEFISHKFWMISLDICSDFGSYRNYGSIVREPRVVGRGVSGRFWTGEQRRCAFLFCFHITRLSGTRLVARNKPSITSWPGENASSICSYIPIGRLGLIRKGARRGNENRRQPMEVLPWLHRYDAYILIPFLIPVTKHALTKQDLRLVPQRQNLFLYTIVLGEEIESRKQVLSS